MKRVGFGLRCRIERGAFSELPTVVDSALIVAGGGGGAVIVVPGGGERLDFIAAGWRSCSRRCSPTSPHRAVKRGSWGFGANQVGCDCGRRGQARGWPGSNASNFNSFVIDGIERHTF